MQVDVWLSAWEIECCYHPIVVGQEWTGIAFFGEVQPAARNSEPGVVRLDDGQTRIVGHVVESFKGEGGDPNDAATLVEAGPLRVFVPDTDLTSVVQGSARISQTIHGPFPFEDEDMDRVVNTGFVRRIWTVSYRYKHRAPLPAEEEALKPPTLLDRIRFKLRFGYRIPIPVPKRLQGEFEISAGAVSFDDDGRPTEIHEIVGENPPVSVERVDRELDGELVRLEIELAGPSHA